MKRAILFVIGIFIATGAFAQKLSCRQDADTKAAICYEPRSLKGNGDLRSFTMATGGPKGVTKSAHLGVVNCRVKYLEFRDKQGVVFARQIPKKRHVRDFVYDVCNEHKPKPDRSLD